MSTTVRELLDHAVAELEAAQPDATLPPEAAAMIGHCGRALRELAYEGPPGLGARRMHAAVSDLARVCQTAASTWPTNQAGTVEPLAGAAADAIALHSPRMIPAHRWAAAVAVAEAARRCGDRAQAFPPCRTAPQLVAVHTAAAAVEQLAALYPPTRSDEAALDTAVPSAIPPRRLGGHADAADAAPALAASLHTRAARAELTMAELLACAAAAETATRRAVAIARALDPTRATNPSWAAAPAAWRAVHRAAAPFDDGTKTRPPDSGVLAWAAHLERACHEDQRRRPPGGSLPDADVTAMRTVMNQLPAMAGDIANAVHHWSRGNYLLARERRLASYEDRNHDATHASNRVVFARGRDLDELDLAVWDARRLSAALAAELDRSSATHGRQPERGLAAAHVAATRSAGTRVLQVVAERAQLGAAAVAGTRQWSFTPRHIDPQPSARRGVDRDRWVAETAALLGRSVTDDPQWDVLQATLDRAAATGYPVADRLPTLAAQAPLPERGALRELGYRVMADCPAAIPAPPRPTRPSRSQPSPTGRRPDAAGPPPPAPNRPGCGPAR